MNEENRIIASTVIIVTLVFCSLVLVLSGQTWWAGAFLFMTLLVKTTEDRKLDTALFTIRLIAESNSCDLMCEHKSCGIFKRIAHIADEALGE